MQLGIAELPESKPSDPASDEGFLKSVHDLIMDVGVHTVFSVTQVPASELLCRFTSWRVPWCVQTAADVTQLRTAYQTCCCWRMKCELERVLQAVFLSRQWAGCRFQQRHKTEPVCHVPIVVQVLCSKIQVINNYLVPVRSLQRCPYNTWSFVGL